MVRWSWIAALTWLAACDAEPQWWEAEEPCPERTTLEVVDPIQGARGRWCARRNGTRHGRWTQLRGGGELWQEGNYFNGRKQGRFASWHPNGGLAEESFFEKGKLHGPKRSWDEGGALLSEVYFEKDEEVEGPVAPAGETPIDPPGKKKRAKNVATDGDPAAPEPGPAEAVDVAPPQDAADGAPAPAGG